jgi:hypothetical protein
MLTTCLAVDALFVGIVCRNSDLWAGQEFLLAQEGILHGIYRLAPV